MSIRVKFQEVIDAFGGTYASADIRTAAYRQKDGAWWNGVTVLRFTRMDCDAVRTQHAAVRQRSVACDTANFRVLMTVRAYAEWRGAEEELSSGVIRHGSEFIRTKPIASLHQQLASPTRSSYLFRQQENENWPAWDLMVRDDGRHSGVSHQDLPWNRIEVEDIQRELSVVGYQTAHQAIDSFLGIHLGATKRLESDFYVSAPIYARIERIAIDMSELKVRVFYTHDQRITDVNSFLFVKDGTYNAGQAPKGSHELRSESSESSQSQLIMRCGEAVVRNLQLDDLVRGAISRRDFGALDEFERQARYLVPAAQVNPLHEILRCFCSDDELRGLLTAPRNEQRKKSRAQDDFERYTAWLLALFGFATVILGQKQWLRYPDSDVEIGSVDVLAFNAAKNSVLLVACSLAPPKVGDVMRLQSVEGYLQKLLKETSYDLTSIVFTLGHNCPSAIDIDIDSLGLTSHGVPIVDVDRMTKMLLLLKYRQEESYFSFLSTRRDSDLDIPEYVLEAFSDSP